jgi:hypothetical protein
MPEKSRINPTWEWEFKHEAKKQTCPFTLLYRPENIKMVFAVSFSYLVLFGGTENRSVRPSQNIVPCHGDNPSSRERNPALCQGKDNDVTEPPFRIKKNQELFIH